MTGHHDGMGSRHQAERGGRHHGQAGPEHDETGIGRESEAGAPAFDELIAEVMATTGRFGHREHVHLTWLAVRRFGIPAAIQLVSDGIQRTARYAGAPQKYHATISRAWVELVGYHVTRESDDGFDTFAERYPALLDKRLLVRHYRPATLASRQAKAGWVEPDLTPFPWRPARQR
jgi:hypothetical protein